MYIHEAHIVTDSNDMHAILSSCGTYLEIVKYIYLYTLILIPNPF